MFRMIFCLILFGCTVLTPKTVYPAGTNDPSVCERLLLERKLQNSGPEIERLTRLPSYILEVMGRINRDSGQRTSGLYRVRTPDGIKALKVYRSTERFPTWLGSLSESILMQEHFGECGLAPSVQGIILPEALDSLTESGVWVFSSGLRYTREGGALQKIPASETSTFGILMDEIPNAWNYPFSNSKPTNFATWSRPRIRERLKAIHIALSQHHIFARDLQYFISGEGELYLADFDAYLYFSTDGKIYGETLTFGTRRWDTTNTQLLWKPPTEAELDLMVDDIFKKAAQALSGPLAP